MTATAAPTTTSITEDELRDQADAIGWVGEDANTPAGHIVATVIVNGSLVTFLLDKENRTVVGRAENHGGRLIAYRGGGLQGGKVLPGIGAVEGLAPVLAQIAAARG